MQTLHIFRKDVRHLWPELLMSGVLLAGFCVVAPQSWPGANSSNPLIEIVSTLLKVLIPVTWLVLIARLVHDECLVGDQQFWITRPYSWISLLGAKLLFVLCCIVLPFVAMQWGLLLQAGIHPWADRAGMMLGLLHVALILWLTFFAVAAVTANLARTFVSLIAVVILWAAVLTIFGGSMGPRMSAPFTAVTLAVVCGGLMVGAVVYQYATRRTTRSRMVMVAAGILLFGLLGCSMGLYFAGVTNLLVRHHYSASAKPALHLAFHADTPGDREPDRRPSRFGVTVHLPITVEGLDAEDRLHDTNASLVLDAPGYHFVSPWRPVVPTEDGVSLLVPKDVYNRVYRGYVHLHLSLIAELLTPGTPQVVTAGDHFRTPDNGSCILAANQFSNNVVCRYAYRSPPPTRIVGMVTAGPCGHTSSMHLAGASILVIPAGGNPDPVVEERLELGGSVCPGTQLTFVTYHPAGNVRMDLDAQAVQLASYRLQ